MKKILLAVIIPVAMACTGHGNRTASSQQAAAPGTSTARTLDAVDFNADSAYSHVAAQVGVGPRIPGTPAHAACADYIAGKLRSYGADTVAIQRATVDDHRGGSVPVANIFARYNSDARHRVLLLAHYDTRPWADNDPDPSNHHKPVPGANDGASGVGVLLELARQLGQKSPAAGVDILMVDAEDGGDDGDETSWCLGTQQWLRSDPFAGSVRPAYAILLDMVGGEGAVFRREIVSDYFARSVNDRIWAVADASGYADRFVNAPGGGVTDDHLFINRAGIPAVDIIDAAHPATGSFPPQWHTVADDLPAISASTLKAVGQTVANVVYSEKSE
ncbi:M28 family peptidase [uncultured Muribaculum sp.]|uniref:M28 family peptidase n=1 Tax=uncultured Muribaculum sp. TaxID=1918613 RepID=UPI0025F19DFE|nr:M28 family peptidase [uncultured Muribaculum sp.]